MLWIFKRRETIAPPMELMGIVLTDSLESGREKYLQVCTSDAGSLMAPASNGFNPEFIERQVIIDEAIKICEGKILDIGACNGKVSLELQQKGYEVTANDISTSCASYLKKIGIKNVLNSCVHDIDECFDTILLLGSTLGICGEVKYLPVFFSHIKSLLNPGGCVLIEDVNVAVQGGVHQWRGWFCYKNFRTEEVSWVNLSLGYMVEFLKDQGFSVETLVGSEIRSNYLLKATLS